MHYDAHAAPTDTPEDLSYVLSVLWHEFALSVRNARPEEGNRDKTMRVDFGTGPRVENLAQLFHGSQSVPGDGVDPLVAFAHIGFMAGHDAAADAWLDQHLRMHHWSLPGLWAATRDKDFRHDNCRTCPA